MPTIHPLSDEQPSPAFKITFFSLPREIRDEIYHHALYKPSPIVVSDGTAPDSNPNWHRPGELYYKIPRCKSPLHVATNLLRTNRLIASEAAKVLYSVNTFSFLGYHYNNWAILWWFLYYIGDANRHSIRRLFLELEDGEMAKKVFRHADGTLTLDEWHLRHHPKICPPSVHPALDPVAPIRKGFVEPLDPGIRTCFRRIGGVGPKVCLTIKWRYCMRRSTYAPEMVKRIAQEETGERVKVEMVWASASSS